ncbi:putative RNA-binding Zn ribbon-like protein [Streptomyces sp. 1114.5]|uniref:CGNR zinc finger domain-containing protein n=1 Tax=Streptomyces sp. 1114.5 TaxID=1938830 RepID=UPI000EAF6008|nr:CGNR zinc finger domain-containing protein [Streptomyces sp. 1114.5]RKT16714.1 putative RNA-binding Zn ribbon-like protein [Streptomyces sp. 1114.5]
MTDVKADPRDPRPLIGEPLALDLLNTRWAGTPVNDLLAGVEEYGIWLSSAGLAGRCEADDAGLAAIRQAREVIRAASQDAGDQGELSAQARDGLDAVLAHGRIRRTAGPGGAEDRVEADRPEWLAPWLAVDDFLTLLGQGGRRIKQCAHEACILYFFDTSQNGRRRWCRMAVCGNRAKAARHYEKARG